MKLTKEDIRKLSSWGYRSEDFAQIEKAASAKLTVYEIDGKAVGLKALLKIMDRREWLSGIARSAFHYTASRNTYDGRIVCFDSHKLFQTS